MGQNKKVLYAREYSFIYETRFDKFRRKLKEFSSHIFILFSVLTFIMTEFSPILTMFLSSLYFSILFINSITFIDKREDTPIIGIHGKKDVPYFFQLGTAVTSIEDVPDPADVARNPKKYEDKVLYPILVDEKMPLTHMFVVGTTGAGKTTFLINILQQIITIGSGALAVDGKGDKDVYEAFYNTAVDCGREDDFLVINFNKPEESNTFNPLLKGTADEISDIIGNMLDTSGENGFWAGRALTMMKALLSILVPLRDMDLLFDPKGNHQPILTLSLLVKWIDLTNLKNLYWIIRESNELGYLDIDTFNQNEKERYTPIDYERLESYLTSVYVDIHNKNAKISESSSKQHGNSFLMWNEALDMLAGRFGDIFNTDSPTIDMEDVVTNGRIVYVLLPALKVDPRSLSTIGKIILSLLKNAIATLLGEKISGTVEVRYRASAIRPRVPFWSVMDEYGAYAVEGFDNVLAQARSLRVSVAILVQEIASLKKTSEIEAQRLLGNTGLKVALKVEEQKTAEELVEFLGKKEIATIKVRSENQESNERDIEVQEKEQVTVNQLKSMTAGHGMITWAGTLSPMLVRYYDPPIAPEIPEFSEFNKMISPNYKTKEFIQDIGGDSDMYDTVEDEVDAASLLNKEFGANILVINDKIKGLDPVEVDKIQSELNNIYREIIETKKVA